MKKPLGTSQGQEQGAGGAYMLAATGKDRFPMTDTAIIPRTATNSTPQSATRRKLRPKTAQKPARQPSPLFLQLLAHLWRGGPYGYWWTGSEARGSTGDFREKRTFWQDASAPGDLPPEAGDYGPRHSYYGVHPVKQIPERVDKMTGAVIPPQSVRASLEDVAAINCLVAEFDAKDFGGSKAAARAHVESLTPRPSGYKDSGGGYQAWWLLYKPYMLDTPEARDRAKHVQREWVKLTGGDKGAADLARVFRMPDTRNYKAVYGPDFPTVEILELDLERQYTFEELAALVPPEPQQISTPRPRTHYSLSDDLLAAASNVKRLALWRCDDREEWLKVGMALHTLGDSGLPLWDDWSQKSSKYKEGECERLWRSFGPREGKSITLASLAYWAREDDPRPTAAATPRKVDAASTPDARALEARLGELEAENARLRQFVQTTERIVMADKDAGWQVTTKMVELYTQLELLKHGDSAAIDRGASSVAEAVGISVSTASTHLQRLKSAGLVDWRPRSELYDRRRQPVEREEARGRDDLHWESESVVIPLHLDGELPALKATEYDKKQRSKAEESRKRIKMAAALLEKAYCPCCGELGTVHATCQKCDEVLTKAHPAVRGALLTDEELAHFEIQNDPEPEPSSPGFEIQKQAAPPKIETISVETPKIESTPEQATDNGGTETEAFHRLPEGPTSGASGEYPLSVSVSEAPPAIEPAIPGKIRTKLAEGDTKAARALLAEIPNKKERDRLSEEVSAVEWAKVQALCNGVAYARA